MSELVDKIPESFFAAMAKASGNGHLAMMIILSPEVMGNLKQHKPALLKMEDGTTIILISPTIETE